MKRMKRARCYHAAFGTSLTTIVIDREALAIIARMLAAEAKADADRDRLNRLAEEMRNAR
jgi:hypothetical protein